MGSSTKMVRHSKEKECNKNTSNSELNSEQVQRQFQKYIIIMFVGYKSNKKKSGNLFGFCLSVSLSLYLSTPLVGCAATEQWFHLCQCHANDSAQFMREEERREQQQRRIHLNCIFYACLCVCHSILCKNTFSVFKKRRHDEL